MKYNKGMLAFVLFSMSHLCMAVPITNLVSTDPNIFVGEQFQIQVWLDNDVANEPLLAFGFDIAPVSPLLNYTGYAIGSDFMDVSFAPGSVQGLAFPGITDTRVLFATLIFDAVGVGVLDLSIQGINDGGLLGVYYGNLLGFDIAATTSIVVNPQAQNVNEPAVLMLIVMSVVLLLRRKLRMKC